MFIAMWNIAGCLPEMDPVVTEKLEEAKSVIEEELKSLLDGDLEELEDEEVEEINESLGMVQRHEGPFALALGDMVYSVTKVLQT